MLQSVHTYICYLRRKSDYIQEIKRGLSKWVRLGVVRHLNSLYKVELG